jgi:hypothetical protein
VAADLFRQLVDPVLAAGDQDGGVWAARGGVADAAAGAGDQGDR